MKANRRKFIASSLATAAGVISSANLSASPFKMNSRPIENNEKYPQPKTAVVPIRFAVIGLNHGHIYGQSEAVIRNGGQLVSFFAKEPELISAFFKTLSGCKTCAQ